MNCWHCNIELIWGGDHDVEDNDEYDIVSNLHCPTCKSVVYVYHYCGEQEETTFFNDGAPSPDGFE